MAQQLGAVTVLVRDYDDALAHYCDDLGFELVEDTDLGGGRRWVRVAPRGSVGATLLLARAATPEQEAAVGNQTGGRVAFFLQTDDFWRDHARYEAAGVRFLEAPRDEPYGVVAVFEDAHGLTWDLIQPRSTS
ncbi:MAG: VOC family protein [Actinobacteria bacterium]|nr:VOC family protein [Actinomycetota bacterium]